MFEMSYIVTQHLWLGLSFFMMVIFVLNRTNIFRRTMLYADESMTGKLFLIAVFSLIGIVGTYWGVNVELGVINTRAVGVIVGGLIGGPIVGSATGFIVGLHRSVFLDSFSTMESGIVTMLQGIIAGLLSSRLKAQKEMWPYALAIGFVLEIMHMALLLVFVEPLEKARDLVEVIAPPMLLSNALGVGIFIGILEDTYKRNEKMEGAATKTALYVASLTMSILRNGLDEKSARETVRTIIDATDNFDCVAILSNKRALALVAKDAKKEEKVRMNIEMSGEGDFLKGIALAPPLKSQIIVPIYNGDTQVASLLLGSTARSANSTFEAELAGGLGKLISAQVEIGKVKEQAKLLASAEIKALQSQINPHFLFNALNTISYYCRTQPGTAKKLLTYLADYYRHNLSDSSILIPFQVELQHINAYVNIEMARFGERLRLSYETDPDLSFRVPVLIMQPLVENAIKHGIQPKATGGKIKIKVVKEREYYELAVEDDGVGMDGEQLENLLYDDPTRKSIGLSNVHKRLITVYGPDNGLEVRSEKNKGTVVSFRIPIKEVDIDGFEDTDS